MKWIHSFNDYLKKPMPAQLCARYWGPDGEQAHGPCSQEVWGVSFPVMFSVNLSALSPQNLRQNLRCFPMLCR